MIQAKIDYMHNELNDEFYTPEYAVYPLLDELPPNLKVWECTDFGESNITKVLKDNGYDVVSTNKQELDFLKDDPTFEYDVMITNPPYSLKDEFLERAYQLGKPFAMLMPITTLEGVKRGGLFSKYGIQLLIFDKRVNYINNKKSNWFNTSWFCWNLLKQDIKFIHLEKDNQIKLFEE